MAGRRSTRTGEKVRRSGFKDGKRGNEKREAVRRLPFMAGGGDGRSAACPVRSGFHIYGKECK
ncbi:hypothetical protein B4135_2497 [Caldibacillus debilis]|uniref:Uncharacterized protein n=1 Tax=Caldibacillus debilis TaxID=301148 RepID=A0A150LYZ9_9BACI|nr:hypothetical protein B4135_2497 [Caldibacillus debilis]